MEIRFEDSEIRRLIEVLDNANETDLLTKLYDEIDRNKLNATRRKFANKVDRSFKVLTKDGYTCIYINRAKKVFSTTPLMQPNGIPYGTVTSLEFIKELFRGCMEMGYKHVEEI